MPELCRRRCYQEARLEQWSDRVLVHSNTLVFVHRDFLQNFPALKEESERTERSCLALVHPRLFSAVAQGEQEQHEKAELYIAEAARMQEEESLGT